MKRYLILLAYLFLAGNIAAQSLQGDGTIESPYLVVTAADLDDLRNYTGPDYQGKYFRMTGNIDLTDWITAHADTDIRTNGWKPIGSNAADQRFYGNFHGGGHAVTGIWMNRTTNYNGLFAYVQSGTIESVGIKVPAGKELKGGSYTAGIAGYQTDGSLINCYFSGTLSGSSYAAGIVGYGQRDTLRFCYSEGIIKGSLYTGGIAGYTAGAAGDLTVVQNCISRATIDATASTYVAGIVGYSQLNTRLEKNVALNNEIIQGAARVAAKTGTAVFENNHALETMLVGGSTRPSTDASSINGNDQTAATLQTAAFYTALGWTFGDIWTIDEAGSFPHIAAVAVAPTLDANRITTTTAVLEGNFIPEAGSKVWVKIGPAAPVEASLNAGSGTWTAAISGQKATEMVYVWATSHNKIESLPLSMIVEFANAGTPEDPFQVFSADDLQTMNVFRDKSFILMNDIDLTEWINENGTGPDDFGWRPIGGNDASTAFKGNFDGNHNTISGLWSQRRWDNIGLFGTVSGGSIKNLSVRVATGKSLIGNSNCETGIIAGIFDGTLSNCAAYGTVKSPQEGTGGMVGILSGGEIKNSFVYIDNLNNSNSQGGLVGKVTNEARITNCYVAGMLAGHQFIGGIVGYLQTGSAVLAGNLSALTSISGTVGEPKRIADNSWGTNTLSDNLAWSNMAVNGALITSSDGTSHHGKDISTAELHMQSTYEAIGWVFDSDNWAIWDGHSLPYFPQQTAPAVLIGALYAGATSLAGHYKQDDAQKVWVKIDDNAAQEATLNEGTWTLTVNPLPAGTKISVWATSSSRSLSLENVYSVGFAQGAGTAEDPYRITNGDELNAIRNFLNAHYELQNDIDVSAWTNGHVSADIREKGWDPIGGTGKPFRGSFNGKGYSLKIHINRSSEKTGLFGEAASATFRNIHIDARDTIKGGDNTAGIVGRALQCTIDSCYTQGVILSDNSSTGGIVGSAERTRITWSMSEGLLISAGPNSGGSGGIAGSLSDSCEVSYCYSVMDISGRDAIGGIAGAAYASPIHNSYTSGMLTGRQSIGGIAGSNSADISNTLSSGVIMATGGSGYSGVGGITGALYHNQYYPLGSVTNSFAAHTSLTGAQNVFRIGAMTDNNKAGEVNNNFGLEGMLVQGKVRSSDDAATLDGKDITADALQMQANYSAAAGWDWGKWTIWAGSSLPYFPGQAAPPAWNDDISVTTTQLTGTLNTAETQEIWVKINDGAPIAAAVSGNNWSATVSDLSPDDIISVWGTHPDKRRSFAVWTLVKAEAFEGAGTEEDPYLIKNANDLYAVRYAADESYFKIVNNIDLNVWLEDKPAGWLPIGNQSEPFSGHIDGNGHTISGLWLHREQQSIGLFAYAANATFRNLEVTIHERSITGGYEYSGAIVGKGVSVEFVNCHVRGVYSGSTMSMGGLAGEAEGGKIIQCSFTGAVINSATYAGGLVGGASGTEIRSSYVAGDKIKANYYAGGITSSIATKDALIIDCYTNITVEAAYTAGGITGTIYRVYPDNEAGSIINCYAAGAVTGGTGSVAGGITSEMQFNSTVTGNVAGNPAVTGGTVARILSRSTAEMGRCNNNLALENMQLTGTAIATADSLNGVNQTRRQLFTQTTYEDLGWDFVNTWEICDSKTGFPYLKWQQALCLVADTIRLAYRGETTAVEATPVNSPAGETPTIEWETISTESRVAVDQNGTVTPLRAGVDTLRATLLNSGYSAECIVVVTPAPLTVKADDQTKVYGVPEDPGFTYSITQGALLEDDTLSGELARSTEDIYLARAAGRHPIVQGTLDNPNYAISFVEGTLLITPRPLTITADNKSKVYKEADPVLTYQKTAGDFGYDDAMEDLVLTGIPIREAGETGGIYPIQQGSLEFSKNYAVTFVEGVFTIERAAQTLTLDDIGRKCGDSDQEIYLVATASSGLPVRFESSDPTVAIASPRNGLITVNGAGSTRFTAHQDGDENYLPAQSIDRTFFVDLPSTVIKSKWNNEVLMVDNNDGKFQAYQWFKDGQPIPGASGQSYSIYGFVADYSVTIITTDGKTLKTCPYRPSIVKREEGKIGPNPVRPSQALTIELPYTDAVAQGATVTIYNNFGTAVKTLTATGKQVTTTSPDKAGHYYIKVTTLNNQTTVLKFIVVE